MISVKRKISGSIRLAGGASPHRLAMRTYRPLVDRRFIQYRIDHVAILVDDPDPHRVRGAGVGGARPVGGGERARLFAPADRGGRAPMGRAAPDVARGPHPDAGVNRPGGGPANVPPGVAEAPRAPPTPEPPLGC